MNAKLTLLTGVLALVLSSSLMAQTVGAELEVLNRRFLEVSSIAMNIDYRVFTDHSSSQPLEVKKGHYARSGDVEFNRMEQVESLRSGKYTAVVDYQSTTLLVGNNYPSSDLTGTIPGIDSALLALGNVDRSETTNRVQYTVDFFQSAPIDFDRIEVTVSKDKQAYESITMYYRNPLKINPNDPECMETKPRVEILFTDIQIGQNLSDERLSTLYYFSGEEGDFVPASRFSNYQFINQYIAITP